MMSNIKISQLTAMSAAPEADDYFEIVQADGQTNKRITLSTLLTDLGLDVQLRNAQFKSRIEGPNQSGLVVWDNTQRWRSISLQSASSSACRNWFFVAGETEANSCKLFIRSSSYSVTDPSAANDIVTISETGRVGVRTTSPTAYLQVNSDVVTVPVIAAFASSQRFRSFGLLSNNSTASRNWYMVAGESGATSDKLYFRSSGHESSDPSLATNRMVLTESGCLGVNKAPEERLDMDLATEDLAFVDAGSDGASEQDWIQVKVGENTGYIRVFAAK
ncbi:MAG: hypothetical protein KKB20_26195 [Proteobacteria bacterium]|nr:hypothetical protein [Pseudomonadota bacterium]